MNMEDLLLPRYKVKRPWPQGKYKEGDIITGEEIEILECEKHYHLFERMKWNEARKEEDLPKYIKMDNYPPGRLEYPVPIVLKTIKVHEDFPSIGENYADVEYEYEGEEWRDICNHAGKMSGHHNVVGVEIARYVPATEKEYLADVERIKSLKIIS